MLKGYTNMTKKIKKKPDSVHFWMLKVSLFYMIKKKTDKNDNFGKKTSSFHQTKLRRTKQNQNLT